MSAGTYPVFINGRFLTQPLSGMQRYAQELVGALDAKLDAEPELRARLSPVALVPPGERRAPGWRHIPVREVGRLKGHAWEQIELALAARGGVLLNLISAGPLVHSRSILVMHDAAVFAHPEHFSRAYRTLHRFLRPRLARRARRLVTISEFSRRELARYCRVPESAFTIIPDSAEHILSVEPDASILARHGLTPGQYGLTVGNQTPNKNIALAIRAFVRAAPQGWRLAVAGGGSDRIFAGGAVEDHPSVARLGRVSDGELRALYENAGLFLFPSRYEGFGVPPLEAMALGCPVLSSDSSAMPEVLGDAALYFRSDDEGDCARAFGDVIRDRARTLPLKARGQDQAARYTWSAGADALTQLIVPEVVQGRQSNTM